MMLVKGMNILENALFIKYLKDVNLPVEDSIKQLNKMGAIIPKSQKHFIKRIQFEKINERELFEMNNLLSKEDIERCKFIFEKYSVLHVTMVNDQKYEFILNWELKDLRKRFVEVKEQIDFYLDNYEDVNKEFMDELNKNLFKLFK